MTTNTVINNVIKGSVDGVNRQLIDGTSNLSTDWQNRQVFSANGTTVKIDYSSNTQTVFGTLNGTQFEILDGGASTVNFPAAQGASTGNLPLIKFLGSDTDVGGGFLTQGIGGYNFSAGNGDLFNILNPGGTIVNTILVQPSATGAPIRMFPAGTDLNVDFRITGKGTGHLLLGSALLRFPNSDAPANYVMTTDGAGNLSLASIASVGGVTNVTASSPLASSGGATPNISLTGVVAVANGGTSTINRTLTDSSSVISLDWDNRQLIDETGALAISFTQFFRQLYDYPGNISLDFRNRSLYANNGVTINLDWHTAGILDGSNATFKSKGLLVSEAANGKQGVATLAAGTVTVANTSITANSRIFLTSQDNGVVGSLRAVGNPGVGFIITSFLNTDAGVVAYEIFEPA
jgi:hypothetical protein